MLNTTTGLCGENPSKQCETDEYLNGTVCTKCMEGCEKCDSATNCLVCYLDKFRTKRLSTCGYVCESAKCTAGSAGCFRCLTNLNENLCEACLAGYYYNGFTTKCEKIDVA